MIAVKVSNERLHKKAKKFEENVYKTLPLDLRLAGKRTAFYYMEYTTPVSTKANQWPMKNFNERVASDVRKVYPTKSDDRWKSSAYELIKQGYGEERAAEFWHAVKSNTQENFNAETGEGRNTAEAIFDKIRNSSVSKIKKKPDNAAYKAIRDRYSVIRRRTRQLSKEAPADGFLLDARRDSFVKSRQATIGLAKAGWYAADSKLGGQKNYTKARAEEGRFVWPGACRKLMNRFGGGIGSGFVSTSGAYGRFEITNHVRYIWGALPDHLKEAAEKQSRNAMRIVFELRYKNRKNLDMMMK
jgi:hypothetical protein